MIGVFANTAAVIIGSLVGLLFKKGMPKRLTDAVMIGISLCTVYIGISGALKGENTLILIASIVLGALIGTALDIDRRINTLGELIGHRFSDGDGGSALTAQGFVTASLLFCVGSMTIVGSLQSGLTGDNSMIYTKSFLDLISAAMLSVSLGIGVLFSAAFLFVFQGAIVLSAQLIAPFLSSGSVINEMTCAGSLIILALGLNIMGVTKIKVANYLPAIAVAPLLAWIVSAV